jgi:IS1 family transposase
MANILPRDRQIAVIAALTEGVSIRATERLTDTHRDTVMRLGLRVGQGCVRLHDTLMRNLHVGLLEFDEIWSYVGKKQKRLKPTDPADLGDQYVFTALSATHKAIISYLVGKRNWTNTVEFAQDVRDRIVNRPQISSDGFPACADAIERAFGADVDYGQIIKVFDGEPGPNAARRYSPGWVVNVRKTSVAGRPHRSEISTSYVERSNLTIRMQARRFTRLTNGFSKKLGNHEAAVALFVAHYNLCRWHETLRSTPAMALGVTDHIWTIGELIDAAEAADGPELGAPAPVAPLAPMSPAVPQRPQFAVIQGGRA